MIQTKKKENHSNALLISYKFYNFDEIKSNAQTPAFSSQHFINTSITNENRSYVQV